MCTDRNSCGKDKINISDEQSDKTVFEILDDEHKNLTLPKSEFAEAIYAEKDEMKDIDFSEFHIIFNIIKQINDINTY